MRFSGYLRILGFAVVLAGRAWAAADTPAAATKATGAANESAGAAGKVAIPDRVEGRPFVFLIGDSTMADKPTSPPNPEHGWGQLLPRYFRDPKMISNHAQNGRSTKSFIDEGRWQVVLDALRAGDWLIVEFGHNDEKDDPKRHTDPRGSFQENLRRFVREARGKGASVILATPVARRKWSDAGELQETHGDYPAALREVAAAEKVPLLELHALTRELETAHGVEGSKRLHLWYPPGAFERKPDGYKDDTHFSEYGADRVAALAVQEMIRLQLPLCEWLK